MLNPTLETFSPMTPQNYGDGVMITVRARKNSFAKNTPEQNRTLLFCRNKLTIKLSQTKQID